MNELCCKNLYHVYKYESVLDKDPFQTQSISIGCGNKNVAKCLFITLSINSQSVPAVRMYIKMKKKGVLLQQHFTEAEKWINYTNPKRLKAKVESDKLGQSVPKANIYGEGYIMFLVS